MQINFAIPPISHFRRWLGEFFSLFQSYEISITLSINSLGKSKTFWPFYDSPEITLPAAKARFAQVLRNSPRAMPLLSYPLTRGCPARHLMMPCQSLPDTRHRSQQIHRRLHKANCAAQPRAAPLALCLGRAIKCKSTGILH